jgi:hypothetical protein
MLLDGDLVARQARNDAVSTDSSPLPLGIEISLIECSYWRAISRLLTGSTSERGSFRLERRRAGPAALRESLRSGSAPPL